MQYFKLGSTQSINSTPSPQKTKTPPPINADWNHYQ